MDFEYEKLIDIDNDILGMAIKPYVSEIVALKAKVGNLEKVISRDKETIEALQKENSSLLTWHEDSGLKRDKALPPKWSLRSQKLAVWYCPMCGKMVSNWEKYCNICGQRIGKRTYDESLKIEEEDAHGT